LPNRSGKSNRQEKAISSQPVRRGRDQKVVGPIRELEDAQKNKGPKTRERDVQHGGDEDGANDPHQPM